MSDNSLGSGQVESRPDRPIIHFGSPLGARFGPADFPQPSDSAEEETPTREPRPEIPDPERDKRDQSWWRRWFR